MSKILSGNPNELAIESYVDEFLPEKSWRAIGCFLIHVGGRRFGVERPRATALACSFDEVRERLRCRGKHIFSPSEQVGATEIAFRVLNSRYCREFSGFEMKPEWADELDQVLFKNKLIWAPDGDAAFDDGGHIIQIDEGDMCRIVAFNNGETDRDTRESVVDVRLSCRRFYDILAQWSGQFEDDWAQFNGDRGAID